MQCIVHSTIGVVGRVPAFADPLVAAAGARVIVVCCGTLILFNVVEDHIHVLQFGPRVRIERDLQRAAARIERELGIVLDVPRSTEVRDEGHLKSVFPYILTQNEEHGLDHDDALWMGSCLPELLGIRALDGFEPPVRSVLSWYRPHHALKTLGLSDVEVREASDAQIVELGLGELRGAVAFAHGVDPAVKSKRPEFVAARRSFIDLAAQTGQSSPRIAEFLGVSGAAVRSAASASAPDIVRVRSAVMFMRDVADSRLRSWRGGRARASGRNRRD